MPNGFRRCVLFQLFACWLVFWNIMQKLISHLNHDMKCRVEWSLSNLTRRTLSTRFSSFKSAWELEKWDVFMGRTFQVDLAKLSRVQFVCLKSCQVGKGQNNRNSLKELLLLLGGGFIFKETMQNKRHFSNVIECVFGIFLFQSQ